MEIQLEMITKTHLLRYQLKGEIKSFHERDNNKAYLNSNTKLMEMNNKAKLMEMRSNLKYNGTVKLIKWK